MFPMEVAIGVRLDKEVDVGAVSVPPTGYDDEGPRKSVRPGGQGATAGTRIPA